MGKKFISNRQRWEKFISHNRSLNDFVSFYALPRPQEEEETDKSKQAQIEQTYEKH